MTDFHWTTCEINTQHQNALSQLQESASPSLNTESWARPYFSESDDLVRSPSSYSTPDSWFSKDTLSDFQADSPSENWAQQQQDDDTNCESRSDTFRSLDTDWVSPTHHVVQPPDHKLSCTYRACTASPFQTLCDFKSHLRDHSADVLRRWEADQPCRCPWSGNCKSKAIFKSKRTLQTHLENVHVTPLVCTVSGCAYRNPFRSNYDLKRHVLTAHSRRSSENTGQFFNCPYVECERETKTFVRKDKWLIHIASCHEGTECPFNHCEVGKGVGVGSHEELMRHVREGHGKFECGLGSCGLSAASRFIEAELLGHLELQHGLSYAEINKARSAVKLSSDKTIKPTDLSSPWRDCKHCEEKKSKVVPGEKKDILNGVRNYTLSLDGLLG